MAEMDAHLRSKRTKLDSLLSSFERVVVAYSGGVDSTLLAAAAHETLGHDSLMVTAVSASLARREKDEAASVATERGWNHRFVHTRELDREAYARNTGDRCYWCKTELFEVLSPLARERGARLAVGTNVDDLSDHRPGLKAAAEFDVVSPLVHAGLTKLEVRQLSKDLGLPTAGKPASPCLSSRVAYGIRVTPDVLRRIEKAETFIRGLGFDVVRVRHHGLTASVEVGRDQVGTALRLEDRIGDGLRTLGYDTVTVDPAGYRMGSLNELLIQSG